MRTCLLLLAFAFVSGVLSEQSHAAEKRQNYQIEPAIAKKNAELVANDLNRTPADSVWRNAPAVYYVVSPLSDIKRLPELYPVDGILGGSLDYLIARGEFEPGSFLVYAKQNVDKLELKVSDLKSKSGTVIPASALDAKLVKVWYQCGAGWFGFMADPLRRTLTPELLVYDEQLIFVDPGTQDNYVRYSNADGSSNYEWLSADFMVTNYQFSNMARIALMKDADVLQPVVLNKDEFKQFMVTLHVPEGTQSGLYTGSIELLADGKTIGSIPVRAKVLPFDLPEPATNYNINKPFILSMYGTGGAQDHPRILKNLVDHNCKHLAGTPNLTLNDEAQFVKEIEIVKKAGASLRPLFFNGPGVGLRISGKQMTPLDQMLLDELSGRLNRAAELCQRYLGHTDVFCYGIDEGGYYTIRGERLAWKAAHAAGLKTMVSTHDHQRMLYPLDFMVMPRMPSEERAAKVRKFHESHPNGYVGWYADPHSGPENPDYFRRIHGLMSYKCDYDFAANYSWYRNDWNDFAIAYESNYRGLIMVYAISDRILDTLAWEGVREGVDDIRYATKVKQLAMEAEKSGNADALHIGRKALGYITYWDVRESPDTFRIECINYILELQKALNKESKQ